MVTVMEMMIMVLPQNQRKQAVTSLWEPTWITSNMKDQWGTGLSWENNTLFDFEGNVHQGIEYINYDYGTN